METVQINLGSYELTMVYIPGFGEVPGFYVSETPVTIEMMKALSPKGDDEWDAFVKYIEECYVVRYENYSPVLACTVHFVETFLETIEKEKHLHFQLPSRNQWLHLATNYYGAVKWCFNSHFLGTQKYQEIAWEMTRENNNDIYCLLGLDFNKEEGYQINGSNFTAGEERGEERDNIVFRLVCPEIVTPFSEKYGIGDYYDCGGVKGVVISSNPAGTHGLLLSMEEAALNWHESKEWCKKLKGEWRLPSVDELITMRSAVNLRKIQQTLIKFGMPLCFGDKYGNGMNHHGHSYWTATIPGNDPTWRNVFCLDNEGFNSVSSDYLESDYPYVRAVHPF